MVLEYPPEWDQVTDSGLSAEAIAAFLAVVDRIAKRAEDPQQVYEQFKTRLGVRSTSSSASWAASDLESAMKKEASSPAAFIASFAAGLSDCGISEPLRIEATVNSVLRRTTSPFRVADGQIHRQIATSILTQPFDPTGTNRVPPGSRHDYELGRELGRGGYGSVYEAIQRTYVGNRECAVKIHTPSVFVGDTTKALARFKREVDILQRLNHRAIVPILEAGETTDGNPFIAMPLIRGADIRSATPLDRPLLALARVAEVLSALHYAHELGVLHRDIKPRNVLVRDSDDQIIVLDFGLAYLVESASSNQLTRSAPGSDGYIPPEVVADPTRRERAHDIFSCGVMLYELLCGKLPNVQAYQSVGEYQPGLSSVDEVLARAIGPVAGRHATALELREDILSVLSQVASRSSEARQMPPTSVGEVKSSSRPLKAHEVAFLQHVIAAQAEGGALLATIGRLRSAMERAGFNSTATALAARRLLTVGLVTQISEEDMDGQVTCFAASDSGWAWLEEHMDELPLKMNRDAADDLPAF